MLVKQRRYNVLISVLIGGFGYLWTELFSGHFRVSTSSLYAKWLPALASYLASNMSDIELTIV